MRKVEASAKTREEAIQNGLKELGVEMYEVDKIEILDEGSKGLFGFGARPVKVRLVVENLPDLPQARKQERASEDKGGRERGTDRGERGGERGGRERGRDERGPRPERPQEAKVEREPHAEREARPEREKEQRGDRGGERGGDRGGRGGQDRGSRNDRGGDRGGRGGQDRGPRGDGARRDDRGGRDRDRDRNRDGRGRGGDRPRRDDRPAAGVTGRADSEYGYDPDLDPAHGAEGVEVPVQEAREERAERPERPRRERSERPERRERPPREERAPRPARQAAEDNGDDAEATEAEAGPQNEQTQAAEEESFAPLTDAQGAEAAESMREIIAKMGIEATCVFERNDDGGARLNIQSEDGAILIGRKGRTLSAMQYLINRMISRGDTAENTERLVVDVGGYVDRRRESLQEMARNLAEKAKGTGRNMRLKPMSPQERRIIHVTLQDDEEVRTFSLGESLYRSVVISPKNADPNAGTRSPRGGRGRGYRGGRGRGGRGRDRFEVDAGQFGD